eukprot:SAG25_NODE_896_length_4875_cov_4.075586_1_plen_68_part_00
MRFVGCWWWLDRSQLDAGVGSGGAEEGGVGGGQLLGHTSGVELGRALLASSCCEELEVLWLEAVHFG